MKNRITEPTMMGRQRSTKRASTDRGVVVARSADEFVESFVAEIAGHESDVTRLVTTPSGLDAAGIVQALEDPILRRPGNQALGIQLMADLMAPAGSIYYDAIYGAFHGQSAIRGWLLPTMASIDFIEFLPTAEPVLFDDGLGGTTLDEWEMVAVIGEDRMPLSRGVSVRRIRDGWISWACDVYDTGPFRQPPPPDIEVDESAAIPEWPRTQWVRDMDEAERPVAEIDVDAIADRFHPTDAVYHDPVAGQLLGRDAVRSWLRETTANAGHVVFEPLGPRLDDGEVSVQEWQQMAVLPSGDRSFVTRGTSVRRTRGGEVVYAADYYDTASLNDPDVLTARAAAGATLG